ncbi:MULTISPECIES: isopentenyl phosphate kinase [Fervidicoccus]|uniref:Isopentenyl phosphate kinase n=1 Tax=Fervidicoccus fontis (strain DSM 19380 / JCM 18336 / VKM B-2539 / Kam940) TaxID=1163730 RepID=I0A0D9_FERFK|nr:isopentenyl phosphate kinase [Fervidicoccus fontis]AFH42446.1 acetylglutamate kinase, putative [Fervidicoccus fontis Kam940]
MKVVIKLGGSLITDKSKPYSFRKEVVIRIAKEIKRAIDEKIDLVVIHGGGSFGHVEAKRAIDIYGRISNETISPIAFSMQELNYMMTSILVSNRIKAVSFPPHSLCVNLCNIGERFSCDLKIVKTAIEKGSVPILFGDIVYGDNFCDPAIISGDDLALMIGSYINAERIIFFTDVDGVFLELGHPETILKEIRLNEIDSVIKKASIYNNVVDVTSGLLGKLKKTYQYLSTSSSIKEVWISNGLIEGNIYNLISGKTVNGTKIIP